MSYKIISGRDSDNKPYSGHFQLEKVTPKTRVYRRDTDGRVLRLVDNGPDWKQLGKPSRWYLTTSGNQFLSSVYSDCSPPGQFEVKGQRYQIQKTDSGIRVTAAETRKRRRSRPPVRPPMPPTSRKTQRVSR